MREAVKSAVRFTTAPAWAGYVLSTVGLTGTSDAAIDAYVKANAGTIYHPVGTASMSPKGAQWGVVDPDLTVKGLTGLRIVDVSVAVRPSSCVLESLLSTILFWYYSPSSPQRTPRPRRMSSANVPRTSSR
jgi:choline dehydrogenase-like flavoprotein